MKRIFNILITASFLLVFALTTTPQTNALSNYFPDGEQSNELVSPVSGQNNTYAVTARPGGGTALNAPTAQFKVFSSSSSFGVWIRDICRNFTPYYPNNIDNGSSAINYPRNEQITVYALDSNENPISPLRIQYKDTGDCGSGDDLAFSINSGWTSQSNIRGDLNPYVVLVSVTRPTSQINGFYIRTNPTSSHFATFAEVPSGLADSYAEPSYRSFALLDRSFYYPNEVSYNLRFAADCSITSNTRTYLRWEDADLGGSNEDGDISFRLRNLTTGNYETISVVDGSNNPIGSPSTTVSGAAKMGGGGIGSYRAASFTARPDHRYRWEWRNSNGNNGIQIWMPFNQINTVVNCGDFDYRARLHSTTTPARNSTVRPGDDIVIRGDARNAGSLAGPNYRYDIYRTRGANSYISQVALSSGGSWVAADHARWTGGSIGAGGNTANRAVRYRVTTSAPDGARICFITRVSPRTSNNSGWHYNPNASGDHWCYTVNNPTWNYTINISRGTSDTATGPKPGSNITIRSRVTNTGDGLGADYSHRFRVMSGGGLLADSSTIRYSGLSGLASGSGRTRNATFQVASDATHGGRVCFRAEVAPYRGYTYPLPPSGTSSGWRPSSQICYTIYNQRFELENSPNIGFNPTSAGPGENIDVSYSINNSDAAELNADYPNAATGPTSNLSVRTQVTTGNASVTAGNANAGTGQIAWGSSSQQTLTITIDNNVSVGDNVCVRVFVNWEQGYSDGTGLADNPAVDNTRCLNVSDGPYLQVLGHDTWAGGAYSIGGSCAASGTGDILSNARPSLTSSGTGVGAMDQYAAFAEGAVSGFGTANDALTDTLTFANDSTLGNFGANRCLANLFDSGGAGGNIDDGLWNNATPIDNTDFNSNSGSFDDNSEGQFRLDSDVVWNNNGRPLGGPGFSGNATILINGDFEIRSNIRLNDSLSVGDVPFLIFVVSGDIRIENDVSRLDGIYISYGQLDTCNTFGSSSLTPVTDLTADGPCNQHLEVNGSFIANDIALRRTHGGTNEAASGNDLDRCRGSSTPYFTDNSRRCAAETIIFHPWFWLAEPFFDRGGGPEANQYPIQQIRDLPPIF